MTMMDVAKAVFPIGAFSIPRHVAIIMDGNGRRAAARGEGRRRGVEALRRTVRAAGDLGIGILEIECAAQRLAAEVAAGRAAVAVRVFWPDFDHATLAQAIIEFRRRERRLGGLVAQSGS